MNLLSLSTMTPLNRTAAYYNELISICECLARLKESEPEDNHTKKICLAVIRSIFQTGNSDKIKACLDMRVPNHITHYLNDGDADTRKECLLIFYEISKGLQDENFYKLG